MVSPLQFSISDEAIGLVGRGGGGKPGPEQSLVENFVEWLKCELAAQPGPTEWAIFHEPALLTGYPDLVLAEYDPQIYENWSSARYTLQRSDIKVLELLHYFGGMVSADISEKIGLRGRLLITMLERLLDSELIYRKDCLWRPIPLNRAFGVKNLIAIEAKISNWQAVFDQALANKWFASESYVLLPVQQPSSKVLQYAEQNGAGIYLCNAAGVQKIEAPICGELPTCYASWYFNEWIGRKRNLTSAMAAVRLN